MLKKRSTRYPLTEKVVHWLGDGLREGMRKVALESGGRTARVSNTGQSVSFHASSPLTDVILTGIYEMPDFPVNKGGTAFHAPFAEQ